METSAMFEQASRLKIRFDSPRGLLTIEDLWDLPLESPTGNRVNLDSIAVDLHRQTRSTADVVSFVSPAKQDTGKDVLTLKFEIVKHIIGVRVAERNELKAASDRKEKKARLLELIARKEDETLAGKSIEDLRAMVESL